MGQAQDKEAPESERVRSSEDASYESAAREEEFDMHTERAEPEEASSDESAYSIDLGSPVELHAAG